MKVDHKGTFKFSPLQSDYAKSHLDPKDVQDLTSVVVLINGKAYRKAPGVLMALSELGGIWTLSNTLKILPESILNLGYDMVARNRYKLFGKRDTCRLPTPEERTRFIT